MKNDIIGENIIYPIGNNIYNKDSTTEYKLSTKFIITHSEDCLAKENNCTLPVNNGTAVPKTN